MLCIVMTIFAICWLPFQAYNILQEIFPAINEYKYINLIWFSCHLLAMSNSCCNPFIYAIWSENFGQEFRNRFYCCCLWLPRINTSTTSSAPAATNAPRNVNDFMTPADDLCVTGINDQSIPQNNRITRIEILKINRTDREGNKSCFGSSAIEMTSPDSLESQCRA